eukprot:5835036-Amphidinium_carterae.1
MTVGPRWQPSWWLPSSWLSWLFWGSELNTFTGMCAEANLECRNHRISPPSRIVMPLDHNYYRTFHCFQLPGNN